MKIIRNIFDRLGYVPKPETKGRGHQYRGFSAAQQNRLTGDFPGFATTFDSDIRSALSIVRSRSRELCKNNPHGKRFTRLMRMNVPGPKGFKFQSNVTEMDLRDPRNPRKVQDKTANAIIEEAFNEWSKPYNCSVTGCQSFKDLQHLAITHAARDGEILIREIRNRSTFRYQLQILEPDLLDETYNGRGKNGNVIRMGVEFDEWRRPVAYYLKQFDAGLDVYGPLFTRDLERVPASQIIHVFDQESAFQSRGMPWTTASLMKLHMLGEYEFAAVTKARVGANNLGFFEPDKELAGTFDGGDSKDEDGNIIVDADPLGITELPPGMKFNAWNPEYPSQQYEMFVKAIQRSVASGLDVSYMSLTTDLNDTTYGSGRIGVIDERESYKERQEWFIQHVMNRIFNNWLEMAMLSDQLRLPMEKFDKFNKPVFIGRRWSWLDPLKDAQAAEKLLQLRLTTRTQLAAEQGEEFVEILQDTADEIAAADELGIDLTIKTAPAPKEMKDDEAKDDEEDMPKPMKKKDERETAEAIKKRNGHSLTHINS